MNNDIFYGLSLLIICISIKNFKSCKEVHLPNIVVEKCHISQLNKKGEFPLSFRLMSFKAKIIISICQLIKTPTFRPGQNFNFIQISLFLHSLSLDYSQPDFFITNLSLNNTIFVEVDGGNMSQSRGRKQASFMVGELRRVSRQSFFILHTKNPQIDNLSIVVSTLRTKKRFQFQTSKF